MARPCKSVKTMSKNLTNEEKEIRLEAEEKLRGAADKIKPPQHLTVTQINIFNYIVSELEASGILSNLDVFLLATCSIAIDRLQFIERTINNDNEAIWDKDLLSAKDKYTKDLFRCTNELSLSPQSRAKLANINLQSEQEKADPLLQVLSGGKA